MHERIKKSSEPAGILNGNHGAVGEKARFRDAVIMTSLYVAAAVVFGCGIWFTKGRQAGMQFFAGYLVEQSLSVDNLFVFLMLFNYFQVPLAHQGRVLTWGILGAVAMRGVMILAGVAAVVRFRGVILLFAAILLVSAVKLFFESDEPDDLADNLVLRLSKKCVGAVDEYDGDRFFTKDAQGKTRATPLLLCLVCIELSDFVFAVDSIPAVIGVSQDLLIVYSSNIFAILGLRSLYTLVAKAVQDLPYLRPAVALVLAFVGGKMVLEYFGVDVPIGGSLAVVCGLLSGGVGLSLVANRRKKALGGKTKEPAEFGGDVPSTAAAPAERADERPWSCCPTVRSPVAQPHDTRRRGPAPQQAPTEDCRAPSTSSHGATTHSTVTPPGWFSEWPSKASLVEGWREIRFWEAFVSPFAVVDGADSGRGGWKGGGGGETGGECGEEAPRERKIGAKDSFDLTVSATVSHADFAQRSKSTVADSCSEGAAGSEESSVVKGGGRAAAGRPLGRALPGRLV